MTEHVRDCCPSCRLGDLPCEKDCPANPLLLAKILLRLTSIGVPVIERKRYRLQLLAGAALDASALFDTAIHAGFRPIVEQFFYTVGTGSIVTTPQTLELAFVPRNIALAAALASTQRAPLVPTGLYRSVTGGCALIPREDESPNWWNIVARLGREGAAAANLELQVAWIPNAYQFEDRNWGGAGP